MAAALNKIYVQISRTALQLLETSTAVLKQWRLLLHSLLPFHFLPLKRNQIVKQRELLIASRSL